MREDAVAEVLGAHLLGSEPSAALWQRVAHGELSADDAEAQLLAGRQDVSTQERAELERAKQVFAPPSADQQRARLEALLRRVEAEEGEAPASSKHAAKVVPLWSHRSRRWVVALLAAAAAVALTLWLVPPRPSVDDEAFVAQYELVLEKDVDAKRGDGPEPEVPVFELDRKLVVLLRPTVTVKEPVGVVMFVRDPDGQARRLEVEPTLHDRGTVEIVTRVEALGLEVGEQELVVAIGRPAALPSSWDELVEREREGPVGFEVVRRTIRVRPPRAKAVVPSKHGG